MPQRKRLGIMQPYFAPGLGYFDLISLCDEFIVFDTPFYRPKSWMGRNRILHPSSGWQYIKAKTGKVHRGTSIKDVTLVPGPEWRDFILRQLEHYRKTAPFFADTTKLVRECLEADTDSLAKLSVEILRQCCARLDIPFVHSFFSEMDIEMGPVEGPGDWALRISEALRATEYVNPPGGRDLFDPLAFEKAGVKLIIRDFEDMQYEPIGYDFVPSLSIIDVMMWNSPSAIQDYLLRAKHEFDEVQA